MRHRTLFALPLIWLLAACGGAPAPEKTASKAPDKAAAGAEKPAPKTEPAPTEDASAPSEPSGGERPSRSPIDTITAPKVAFLINYPSSAPYEKDEKKCDAASKGDPQKKSQCMQKERSDFTVDVLQFKRDAKGKLWWVTYRKKGSNLTELSKVEIELGNETANQVTLKVVDPRKQRSLFAVKNKFVITVPNDYSLELDEPVHGKLVYDAKIDILTQ